MIHNKKIISLAMLLLWMCVIFSFSAKEATVSSAQSGGIVEIVRSIAEKIIPSLKNADVALWDAFETVLRKIAHGFIYFVLGILCYNFIFRCNFSKKITVSAVICLIYAISDEVHQVFVPGRSGQISDVAIDFTGSILGITIFIVLSKLFCSRRKV